MIKDGIVKDKNIDKVEVIQHIIPRANTTSRPGIKMTPKYITIHNTGNSRKGADAMMHTKFVDNTTSYVSWHFTVDDKYIIQELPIDEVAWHAGDGRGNGNMKSIGIEICENEGIDWPKARLNAIKLVAYLMKELNINISNVVPHKHWSGKQCPRVILKEGFEKFTNDISEYIAKATKVEKSWQQLAGEKAVANLHEKGVINDKEGWQKKDLENETAPLWLIFTLIDRIKEGKDE